MSEVVVAPENTGGRNYSREDILAAALMKTSSALDKSNEANLEIARKLAPSNTGCQSQAEEDARDGVFLKAFSVFEKTNGANLEMTRLLCSCMSSSTQVETNYESDDSGEHSRAVDISESGVPKQRHAIKSPGSSKEVNTQSYQSEQAGTNHAGKVSIEVHKRELPVVVTNEGASWQELPIVSPTEKTPDSRVEGIASGHERVINSQKGSSMLPTDWFGAKHVESAKPFITFAREEDFIRDTEKVTHECKSTNEADKYVVNERQDCQGHIHGKSDVSETCEESKSDSPSDLLLYCSVPTRLRSEHFSLVLDSLGSLKNERKRKLVLGDMFAKNLGPGIRLDDIVEDLQVLSDHGIIRYYDESDDYFLSRFIILGSDVEDAILEAFSRLVMLRSLRPSDSDSLLAYEDTIKGDLRCDDDFRETLGGGMSPLPLLNDSDIQLLCEEPMYSLRGIQQDNPSTTFFYFVKQLLKRKSKIIPLYIKSRAQSRQPDYVFVPSMLSHLGAEAKDSIWSHKSSSWETTLTHIWLFPSIAEESLPKLMEQLSAFLLQELYKFAKKTQCSCPTDMKRCKSVPPIRMFPSKDQPSAVGITIRQILLWKTAMFLDIHTCLHEERRNGESVATNAQIFLSLVDYKSIHFIGRSKLPNAAKAGLIVSGRCCGAGHGHRLWNSGYKTVVEAVRKVLSTTLKAHERVACPGCLRHLPPANAETFSSEEIRRMRHGGAIQEQRCPKGHPINIHLLSGTNGIPLSDLKQPRCLSSAKTKEVAHAVVLVYLFDKEEGCIRAGSGFVFDIECRLIVTAAHIVFHMDEGTNFGTRFGRAKYTEVRVRIRRNDVGANSAPKNNASVDFRADVIAHDVSNVDVCVLQIEKESFCSSCLADSLTSLEMTSEYELNQDICLLGFNQGGEGVHEPGAHLNEDISSTRGYIEEIWNRPADMSFQRGALNPRQEIVVDCGNINGESGGPFVSSEGKVIGILSRGDHVDPRRCYMVPTKEIMKLVATAKYEVYLEQVRDKDSGFGKTF